MECATLNRGVYFIYYIACVPHAEWCLPHDGWRLWIVFRVSDYCKPTAHKHTKHLHALTVDM